MKRVIIIAVICLLVSKSFTQPTKQSTSDTMKVGNFVIINDRNTTNTNSENLDSTSAYSGISTSDTIKVGNFIIIKKNDRLKIKKNRNKDFLNDFNYSKRKNNNLSTNWWILDLGFANVTDNTNYASAQTMGYFNSVNGAITANSMALNTKKSSNVNIWFFMQKLNITHHVVNLKYGLGLEMYNFRYEHNLSYRNNPVPYIFNDSLNFSKDKLYVGYLTVPLMININATPNKRNGFSFSAGVSAGYLIGNHNKQISNERGKQKYGGDLSLQPWRFAAISELGLGPIRLYGSFSLNNLYKTTTGLDQTPYAIGIRFSNW